MASLRTAAVAGIGIVQLPHLIIRDELEAGDLIEVAPPDWAPLPETVHVVFNSRRGILLSVRTLIDFLVSEFEKLDDA
jgi:DNA-binding transcriptional LysR family regulator